MAAKADLAATGEADGKPCALSSISDPRSLSCSQDSFSLRLNLIHVVMFGVIFF